MPLRDLLLSWQQSEFEAAAGTEGIIIWSARVHKQFLLFFDKQRHAASAFCHTLDHFLWQRVTGRLVLRPCAGPVSSQTRAPAITHAQCRQLQAPQFLRRQIRYSVCRQRHIEQRAEQNGILPRIEVDLRQRTLQVGEPLLGRYVGAAETRPAPLSDGMQRCILQQLRATPFNPGVRDLAQSGMKRFGTDRRRAGIGQVSTDRLDVAAPRGDHRRWLE